MFSKIWLGLVGITSLGLLWLSLSYLGSAYYLNRGSQLLAQAESQAAIDHLETVLRFDPDNVPAHRWLAKAYLQLDQPEQALEVAQQTLVLSPNNPLVQLELGDVYDRLKNYEQAITHYEAGGVGDRGTELLVNYLKLADKLWLMGNQEAAASIWRNKVLGYGPADLYANWRLFQYDPDDQEKFETYRQAVTDFPEKTILPPTDSRLVTYQIEAIAGMIKEDLWPREVKLHVLAHQVWRGDLYLTGLLLQRLTEFGPEDADVWYYLAEFYRGQGELEQAEKAYQKTIKIAPDYALAYLRLGMLNEARFINSEEQNWLTEATAWYQQYHQLAPDDPLGLRKLADLCKLKQCAKNTRLSQLEVYLINREPEFGVNQKLGDWRFLGYDVDENRLIRGEPTALWLYWQGPIDAAPISDTSFYQFDQRWVQVVEEAQSLVINGGFEMSQSPIGFLGDLYQTPTETRRVVTDERYGQATQVALLDNTDTFSRTSFISNDFPVESNKFYLQAGWLRSDRGNGRISRNWVGNFKDTTVSPSSYLVDTIAGLPWTHYAEIIKPVDGTSKAQIWLLNYQAIGEVYFDNILFVAIGELDPFQ